MDISCPKKPDSDLVVTTNKTTLKNPMEPQNTSKTNLDAEGMWFTPPFLAEVIQHMMLRGKITRKYSTGYLDNIVSTITAQQETRHYASMARDPRRRLELESSLANQPRCHNDSGTWKRSGKSSAIHSQIYSLRKIRSGLALTEHQYYHKAFRKDLHCNSTTAYMCWTHHVGCPSVVSCCECHRSKHSTGDPDVDYHGGSNLR